MRKIGLLAIAVGLLAVILPGAPALAQATRTWVSGVGDDANPCSRTAPCKTFAGAISKTAAAGEINCLDPGGFGALTITKAISILCAESGEAGVLVSGTNGITVVAGATDVVFLQGLDFEGLGISTNGISFTSGAVLHVDKCVIHQFGTNGISVTLSAPGEVFVTNSFISENGAGVASGAGISISPASSGGNTTFEIANTFVTNNNHGINVTNTASGGTIAGTIESSTSSGNSKAGIAASSAGTAVNVMIDNTVSSNNGTTGVTAIGTGAVIEIGRSTASGNATGFAPATGGIIRSYGNNQVDGNPTTGTLNNGSVTGPANAL